MQVCLIVRGSLSGSHGVFRLQIDNFNDAMTISSYSRFFTQVSSNRKPSLIRELTKVLASAPPEMIPLSGGYPNPAMFPFTRATVETTDGNSFVIEGPAMQKALQYLPTPGLPSLVSWVKELQAQVHNPPLETDVVVTCGSQDGLCKAIEMLLERQGAVVVEDYVYSGTLAIMEPYDPNFVIVEGDSEGMRPDILRKKLNEHVGAKPKFIYLNPTGANPTGVVLPESRRREIYQVAVEHDMLILEDDPYYFLHFGEARPPSFLSMDTDGRVIRFDSFSKVLSSGLRLGFVTGPPPLIERINLHMQASVLHASSLSQVIASDLLHKWGLPGFLSHVGQIEAFYRRRRDRMLEAASAHLTGLCEWSVPQGGMFLWIKVPSIPDTWDMLLKRGMEKNIMLLPGRGFVPAASGSSSSRKVECSYMRAAFSVASESDFDVAFARLANLIREEQTLLKLQQDS